MRSKTQTGLLLVLGTIALIIGWMGLYPADGTESAAVQAKKIMADPTIAKVAVLLGYGGMTAVLMGMFNITRGMVTAAGKGSSYANIVFILVAALISASIIALGLELGVTETTSVATGEILMSISIALASSIQITLGLTLALLGIGIALDKNLHIAVGVLAILTGAAFLISSFVDGVALDFVGWIGFMITSLVLGILTIRSKN